MNTQKSKKQFVRANLLLDQQLVLRTTRRKRLLSTEIGTPVFHLDSRASGAATNVKATLKAPTTAIVCISYMYEPIEITLTTHMNWFPEFASILRLMVKMQLHQSCILTPVVACTQNHHILRLCMAHCSSEQPLQRFTHWCW